MIMDFGKSMSLDSNCKSHRPLSPSLKSHVEMLCFLSEWGEGGRMWHFGGWCRGIPHMQYTAFVTRSLWHFLSYFLRPIFGAKTGQVNLSQDIDCIEFSFHI